MLANGAASLQAAEKDLNAMNVFPVADGDTGTNMLTTLRNGLKLAPDTEILSEYLKAVSSGMLLGARGNSGVILSQIFKGIYLELSRRSSASPIDIRNSFIRGYKAAYEAVIHPEEGTILTVCREGIEQVTRQVKHIPDVETLLRSYLSYMEISLAKTPEILPVLAEMGVVDSGAKGYITLVRGMADALDNVIYTPSNINQAGEREKTPSPFSTDYSVFNADSTFSEGYCMEFILQLLNSASYLQDFDEKKFIAALEQWGSSLVVVRDETRIKVHIHTKTPAPIIKHAQQYGEFLTFKLENMQLQHNEYTQRRDTVQRLSEIKVSSPASLMATVATVNSFGLKEIFEELGCNQVIECGSTMNASTEEFIQAIRAANAEHTVIMPGNSNLLLAAQQAADMLEKDVRVLETKSIPESYFALAMDIQDSSNYEQRIAQMQNGIQNVETLLIATAAKSFSHNGVHFSEGNWVVITHNEPLLAAPSAVDAVIEGIQRVDDIDDKEICVLIRGKGCTKEDEAMIQKRLQQLYPVLECAFLDGGQLIYDWMIGLS